MARRPLLLAVGLVCAAVAVVVAGCGSSATGIDACKTIEEARCNRLPDCPNVTVSPPVWYTTGSAVDACTRYYDVACAHGLSTGSNPATSDVNACVAAIKASCSAVAEPQSDPGCAWLVPPTTTVEAGSSSDAGEEAGD
jgi:hypothetical protein